MRVPVAVWQPCVLLYTCYYVPPLCARAYSRDVSDSGGGGADVPSSSSCSSRACSQVGGDRHVVGRLGPGHATVRRQHLLAGGGGSVQREPGCGGQRGRSVAGAATEQDLSERLQQAERRRRSLATPLLHRSSSATCTRARRIANTPFTADQQIENS